MQMQHPLDDGGSSRLSRWINGFEESMIALLLGLMTITTFVNVIIRYVFDGQKLPRIEFLWAVEFTGFLFAWLVVFGISYCVKVTANLGVDVVIALLKDGPRRLVGLLVGAICIIYALMLLKAGYDYWAPFANLPPTSGRWIATGFAERFQEQGWYEVNDIPMPRWLGFLSEWFNDGERYEKLPRVLPYVILPVGMALLVFRFVQATMRILRHEGDRLIVGHEAEEAVAEAAQKAGS